MTGWSLGVKNLSHTLPRNPKHLPNCFQRRARFSRMSNYLISGNTPSNLLVKFREHGIHLAFPFLLPDGTLGAQ
jgi:hypothetical protein